CFIIPTHSYISLFFFPGYPHHRDLHSFPTRRSSDLSGGVPTHRPFGPPTLLVLAEPTDPRARVRPFGFRTESRPDRTKRSDGRQARVAGSPIAGRGVRTALSRLRVRSNGGGAGRQDE